MRAAQGSRGGLALVMLSRKNLMGFLASVVPGFGGVYCLGTNVHSIRLFRPDATAHEITNTLKGNASSFLFSHLFVVVAASLLLQQHASSLLQLAPCVSLVLLHLYSLYLLPFSSYANANNRARADHVVRPPREDSRLTKKLRVNDVFLYLRCHYSSACLPRARVPSH